MNQTYIEELENKIAELEDEIINLKERTECKKCKQLEDMNAVKYSTKFFSTKDFKITYTPEDD